MPQWLQIAQGLLTPLIAIVMTYIAWQQWQATKLKMRMERYERRLRVNYGPGYRVYYKKHGRGVVILLAGGNKHSQANDIKTALRLARNL